MANVDMKAALREQEERIAREYKEQPLLGLVAIESQFERTLMNLENFLHLLALIDGDDEEDKAVLAIEDHLRTNVDELREIHSKLAEWRGAQGAKEGAA